MSEGAGRPLRMRLRMAAGGTKASLVVARTRSPSDPNRSSRWRIAAIAAVAIFARRSRAVEPDSLVEVRHTSSARPRESSSAWTAVFRDVREGVTRNRVVAIAAGVTFYSLLAIFPAIAALVALYGLFADPATINQHVDALAGLLPGGAIDVIRDQITRIAAQGGGTLGLTFVIGLLLSLWSADGGIKALFDAFNVVYGVPEKRGFIRLSAMSLAFVVGGTLFLLLAIAAVVSFPAVSNLTSLLKEARWLVVAIEWPVMLVIVALVLGLLYRYGPSRPPPKWRWVTWGSSFGSVGWVVASVLFSWYAANFGSFNKTYGALGAVIGFMTWIWISAIVVLVGAGINAAVERLERVNQGRMSALQQKHAQHGGSHNPGCDPT